MISFEVREEKAILKKIVFQELPTLQELIEVVKSEFSDTAFKDITVDFNTSTEIAATGLSERTLHDSNPSLADVIVAAYQNLSEVDPSKIRPLIGMDSDGAVVDFV